MGVCIRTGATLILDLPQIFWKELVGQKITLEDLYEIEVRLTENLKHLLQMKEEEFNLDERYWTVTLADGIQQDLKPDGSKKIVKFTEIEEYV